MYARPFDLSCTGLQPPPPLRNLALSPTSQRSITHLDVQPHLVLLADRVLQLLGVVWGDGRWLLVTSQWGKIMKSFESGGNGGADCGKGN